MPIENPIIKVNHLSYTYTNESVLKDVSFSVSHGDYVGIIGPNGGGKSTLLKILIGLLPMQEGSILINGKSVGLYETQREIGYVPQKIAHGEMAFPATVEEIVSSGTATQLKFWDPFTSRTDKKAVYDALEIAQIGDLKDRLMNTLSGGERQRVYIARALASKPKILILDEPLSGVDIANQNEFYTFLRKLNSEKGLTILFVSHDINVVLTEARSIICLNQGLLCYDKPHHLKKEILFQEMYKKPITHLHHI